MGLGQSDTSSSIRIVGVNNVFARSVPDSQMGKISGPRTSGSVPLLLHPANAAHFASVQFEFACPTDPSTNDTAAITRQARPATTRPQGSEIRTSLRKTTLCEMTSTTDTPQVQLFYFFFKTCLTALHQSSEANVHPPPVCRHGRK